MGKPSERIVIIQTDPITGEVDRQRVLQVAMDFIGALFAVGGKLQIGADRVVVGEVQVGDSVQPIAETHGLVFRYQSFSPARRTDGQLDPEPEPVHDEPQAPTDFELAAEPEPLEEDEAPTADFEDRDDLLSPEEIEEFRALERAGA